MLVVLLVSGALAASAGAADAAGRTSKGPKVGTPPTPVVSPSADPSVSGRSFGVAMDQVPGTVAPLLALSDELGRRPDRVTWYVAWSTGGGFPAQEAAAVAGIGAVPVITWEPWDPARGVKRPTYALSRIAGGAFDPYVRSWAQGARAYGGPVVLRFAHEMNGNWYPWAASVNKNTAPSYAAAWRHVVDVFRAEGATNVSWQWSPNVPYAGSTSLAAVFPGDAYVDSVALDGYNWAGVNAGAAWVSFADVFAPGAQQVRALTQRPLYVGETATAEQGGAKPDWITGMFGTLTGSTTFAGFTWFHYLKEGDWRIDSSTGALTAFREGLAAY
ncbi:glycoside hydrolase family 26 protein [Nocardioides sp.]|uniref:glycoside hydrolase family 26 protein n=1 Tax=Nocardioides sp. TaxID=35761 RepID=UPI002EDB519B